MNRRQLLIQSASAMSLAACAPVVQQAGLPGGAFAGPRIEDDAIVSFDGARLRLQRWLPEGEPWAVVIGLHGMNDYSQSFHLAGPAWAGQGIATYAFDQRGFGRSPARGVWGGEDLMTEDLRTVVALVRARHPAARVVVAGESMGGAVAITAFASDRPPAADEEEEYVVAQANAPLNPDGSFKADRVLVRRSPQAATLGEAEGADQRRHQREAAGQVAVAEVEALVGVDAVLPDGGDEEDQLHPPGAPALPGRGSCVRTSVPSVPARGQAEEDPRHDARGDADDLFPRAGLAPHKDAVGDGDDDVEPDERRPERDPVHVAQDHVGQIS